MIRIATSCVTGKKYDICGDATAKADNERWAVVALSDGAGSKRLSHIGAKVATDSVVHLFPKFIEENCPNFLRNASPFKQILLDTILDTIESYRQENSIKEPIDEFSGTLLFAFLYKPSNRWLIGHLGDGVIGALDCKNELVILSSPDNGEYANETFFFTSKDAQEHFRLYLVKGIHSVVLMSDGPEKSLYDRRNERLSNAVRTLFAWQKELEPEHFQEVLHKNIEQIIATKTDDDCSIAMVQKYDIPFKPFSRIEL